MGLTKAAVPGGVVCFPSLVKESDIAC